MCFVVFLTERKLPRNGVRIKVDSLRIPPFLEEDKKKKKHSMTCAAHAVFAMRRSRVGSRRFVQPELVQKLYRLFKLAAFFFFFLLC